MEESISLNIIYLPDEVTRQKAIELSEKVASKLSAEFVLGQGTIPHITIYQASSPTKNFEKVKKIVREIASKTRPFEIEMGPFSVNLVRGFVWWDSIKTEDSVKMHREIIGRVNPLREGLISDFLKTYKTIKQDRIEIENYGAIFVDKRYHPHLTVTRLKNPEDARMALEILGEERSTFVVKSIALGNLGDHGTVTEIIEEFPLASNY